MHGQAGGQHLGGRALPPDPQRQRLKAAPQHVGVVGASEPPVSIRSLPIGLISSGWPVTTPPRYVGVAAEVLRG